MLKNINEREAKPTAEQGEVDTGKEMADNPFNLAMLKEQWDTFAKQKKDAGKDREYMVMNQKIELLEGRRVVLEITNLIQEDFLVQFQHELVAYLREKLQNDHLTLETNFVETKVSNIPYSNHERLKYLMDKNPALGELRVRLGLDPDY